MGLQQLLMVGLAVAAVSLTVTKTFVFRWWREWLFRRQNGNTSWWVWPYKLFTCPYCFSHWVAGVLMAAMADDLQSWFIQTMAAVTISCLTIGLMVKAMEQVPFETYGEDEE